jgi:hypothetical protein
MRSSLKQQLRDLFATRRCNPARRAGDSTVRPRLEALEDRVVPASLSYSTLFNGTIYATAVDNQGDIYVTGNTGSNLPTTPGALETSGNGAFLAKLNPTGTAVLYATYLGNGGGAGTGIAVDAAGDAYVIGTDSGVPTSANAIASSGGADFVAELNPTGSGLLYGTYLPDTVNFPSELAGYMSAIAVDGSGNIYVAGAAQAGFPTTASAFQPAYAGGISGGTNAFFAKIDPALSGTVSLLYSSYLGGSGGDAATGIALDSAGNAYLEGFTNSSDFPTTSGAFQTRNKGGGATNVFVAKFDPALSGASSRVYSTYLGGSTISGPNSWGAGYVPNQNGLVVSEICGGIAVDSEGNAYVTSATDYTDFPTTTGAYQTTSNIQSSNNLFEPSDVFVTKLNATGSALVYSTYLGGGTVNGQGTHSGGAGIVVDANGDAYVTGWTDSTSFPTKNPVQATNGGGFNGYGGGMDSFVTELNPSGSGLLFSTYLGGSSQDYGYGISLDPAGNVYIGGATIQPLSNFPTTPGAYDRTSGSGFAAKINLAPSPSFAVRGFPSSTKAGVAQTVTVTALNANGTVNTGYTGTVQFSSSDPQAVLPANYTFTAANQGVYTFTVTLKTAGSQSISVTDTTNGTLVGDESGITVTPAAPARVVLSAPSSVKHGTRFSVTVTVEDAYGNVVTNYLGTIHFSSSDPSATLPANYTFTAADAGVHKFSNAFMLRTRGNQTLKATDTQNSGLTATDSINVT